MGRLRFDRPQPERDEERSTQQREGRFLEVSCVHDNSNGTGLQSSINVSQLRRHPLRDYYYGVCACDPLAHRRRRVVSRMRIPLRRRPLGRGHASRRQWHHQPATHITGSWCATIIAYTWTDSCQDFTRCSRTPPLLLPPITARTCQCPGRKIAGEKKRVFARLFVSSSFRDLFLVFYDPHD
ncbi:Uncharacterized protein FWK35_00004860 [Aphis craccivora]|uniref:Uncharacterized protein n=1 Tax=Aphis craccivora TaxID=307492 RepID=A0A6G0ZDX2_APHCR|nr:Uncharacterized protein FWK35_00004860 [Aphis craccivora]